MRNKFERLVQGNNTVEKYRQEFNDLARYAPGLVATEEERCIRFEAGLRIQIRMGLASGKFPNMRELVDAAKRYEGMMEERKKLDGGRSGGNSRKIENKGNKEGQGQGFGNSRNKRSGSMAGFSSQNPSKSSKSDGGNLGFSGCFKCGKPGHRIRDCTEVAVCRICNSEGHMMATCPQTTCYNCGAKGHISPQCPQLAQKTNAPAPSTVGSTQTPVAGRGRG